MTGSETLAWPGAVHAEHVPAAGQRLQVTAPAEALPGIATRLGLEGVQALSVEFALAPVSGGGLRVAGDLDAAVTYLCVASLEPFEAPVHDHFETLFLPLPEEELPAPDEDDPDADWPEPLGDGGIDLGEMAVQQLSLALDPHPRAPGAEPDDAGPDVTLRQEAEGGAAEKAPSGDGETQRPFADLESLLKRDK